MVLLSFSGVIYAGVLLAEISHFSGIIISFG